MSEAEIIDAVVSKLPAEHRASAKAALESAKLAGVGHGTDRATMELLAELMRRRRERVRPSMPPGPPAPSNRPLRPSTHVFIAMSDEPPTPGTPRVSVLRTPTDGGTPTVLVRRDATPRELDLGVKSAAASVARSGPTVQDDIRIDIPAVANDSEVGPKFAVDFLEKLRSNSFRLTERAVGALGKLRGTTVPVRLPEPEADMG
jgi:hypothetical protein